jgi:hypothetical protein
MTRDELEDKMFVLLGGGAAESVVSIIWSYCNVRLSRRDVKRYG